MTVRKVNVQRCELDESLDHRGFRHMAASVGPRIGADRIGAAVYAAEAGHPIWPYHYHHAIEEWVYVISGAPVLRDAGGSRPLSGGDLVCFPPGPIGAHTMHGPGRFIMVSADAPGPYIAVYPDSDKVAVALGDGGAPLVVPRAAAVDYWYGEGDERQPEPVQVARAVASASRPAANTLTVPLAVRSTDRSSNPGVRAAPLAPQLGGERLSATVLEVGRGEEAADYQYAYGREEWMLVLAGSPTLRHPDGEQALEAGDLVCFPEGPAGAHRVANGGEQVALMLSLATTGLPVNVCYPDTGGWSMHNEPTARPLMLRGAATTA